LVAEDAKSFGDPEQREEKAETLGAFRYES